ncbi:MAG: hypothetical protein R2794_11580 [Chitinophagales bacterium]
MKLPLLISGLLLAGTVLHAQSSSDPVILNKGLKSSGKTQGVAYENELSMGLRMATSGWSLFGDYTQDVDRDKKRSYFFELGFLKDPKETKRVNEFTIGFESPKPFVYGKQNSFFNMKVGMGEKYLLGEKAEKSGFLVSFNYAGGFSAGFIKPYYLEVYNTDEQGGLTRSIKYSEETESLFLDATSIYGASGFSVGFNEIQFTPGIFARTGLSFDWATYDDFVKALETGIGAEVYARTIPLMINEQNNPYFVYLYLSLQLGKKW